MNTSSTTANIGKFPMIFSSGEWANKAHGSVVLSFGDTVVLSTACISSKKILASQDFVPLMVDYQERTYAMGKIPGGFFKREGRPKDTEILTARIIDRSLRPLFPKGLVNEVQIVAMLLSSDGQQDPDVFAVNAASCALLISDIPFDKPIAAVRVSKKDSGFIINPSCDEREASTIDLVVAGSDNEIVMLEGRLSEVKEEELIAAIKFAHPFLKEIIDSQKALAKKIGKKKREISLAEVNQDLAAKIKPKVMSFLEGAYQELSKEQKSDQISSFLEALCQEYCTPESEISNDQVITIYYATEKEFVRSKIVKQAKRPDGRSFSEIRPLDCKVRVLPRTHGSATFRRGQTQSLAVVTLGTSADEQMIEALEGEKTKHFMLHYTFPPFSVGEVKPLRGPSRREIGHGALAEKSLLTVIPSKNDFPYTIRLVSEILESNGSSSMATVCASSLAMMDAGVPIKEPVAGVAIGLVKESDDYKILVDIQGAEDHYGDMDFKVAGTQNGLTAIQVDIKIDGLNYNILTDALEEGRKARNFILSKMKESLSIPREVLSKYAPKIKSFKIDPEKIGAVIGSGGKIIRRLQRDFNVTIDIEDETGTVSVVAESVENLEKTVAQINGLVKDIEVGDIYEGKVVRLVNFGAFCEILPGKQGLIHVSEIAQDYVKNAADILHEGDVVKVKVIGIDAQGRINLSIKQV